MFKGLGIMVLLNQMESFLLRLKVEGWTQGKRVSRSTGDEFERPTRATVKGEPVWERRRVPTWFVVPRERGKRSQELPGDGRRGREGAETKARCWSRTKAERIASMEYSP